ncbi:MAG: hypothetical protein HFG76_07720 [Hungatella sp.]|nr:hypothetical protein [Hungatella sp.]
MNAIKNGFTGMMAVIIVGSFCTLASNVLRIVIAALTLCGQGLLKLLFYALRKERIRWII